MKGIIRDCLIEILRTLSGTIVNLSLHRFTHRWFFHVCRVLSTLYRRGYAGQDALSPPDTEICPDTILSITSLL